MFDQISVSRGEPDSGLIFGFTADAFAHSPKRQRAWLYPCSTAYSATWTRLDMFSFLKMFCT